MTDFNTLTDEEIKDYLDSWEADYWIDYQKSFPEEYNEIYYS